MVTIQTKAIASHYTSNADGTLSFIGDQRNEVWEVYCLSTDNQPLDGVPNASALLEMDTGKVYLFDKDGSRWLEVGG